MKACYPLAYLSAPILKTRLQATSRPFPVAQEGVAAGVVDLDTALLDPKTDWLRTNREEWKPVRVRRWTGAFEMDSNPADRFSLRVRDVYRLTRMGPDTWTAYSRYPGDVNLEHRGEVVRFGPGRLVPLAGPTPGDGDAALELCDGTVVRLADLDDLLLEMPFALRGRREPMPIDGRSFAVARGLPARRRPSRAAGFRAAGAGAPGHGAGRPLSHRAERVAACRRRPVAPPSSTRRRPARPAAASATCVCAWSSEDGERGRWYLTIRDDALRPVEVLTADSFRGANGTLVDANQQLPPPVRPRPRRRLRRDDVGEGRAHRVHRDAGEGPDPVLLQPGSGAAGLRRPVQVRRRHAAAAR